MPSSPARKVDLVSDISTLSTLFGKQYDSTTLWFLLTFPGSNTLQLFLLYFHCFPPVLAMRNCLRRIRRLRLRSFRVRQPSPRWPATSTVQRNAKTQRRMLWEGTHWTTSFHSTKSLRSPKGEDQIHSFDNSRSSTSWLKNAPYMAESQPCLHD